jgi:hypothetical protein
LGIGPEEDCGGDTSEDGGTAASAFGGDGSVVGTTVGAVVISAVIVGGIRVGFVPAVMISG